MPKIFFAIAIMATVWISDRQASTMAADAGLPPITGPYVRIASDVSGHVHPAICVGRSGAIVVIFSQSDFKDLKVTRSIDGGRSWSDPALFEPSRDTPIYPGALTTLADGRLLHIWNRWYDDATKPRGKTRHPWYSLSTDEGVTWSDAKSFPENPAAESVLRHPIIELGPDAWLVTLTDRTAIFAPSTGELRPFGDGRNHGLTPLVRTKAGTFISGLGLRSTDNGQTWEPIKPFPQISSNGWRFDLLALATGDLLTAEVEGSTFGGDRWRFVTSHDDGRSWDLEQPVAFYDPGRMVGGRACPKTVELDAATLGTVFYDVDKQQPGGPGLFFLSSSSRLVLTPEKR